ncbi:MAG: DUF6760 family protein [Lachnospiraceae bacterium]
MQREDRYSCKFYGSRTIELYPAKKIYEEAAFIAYYLHWSHDDIMALSHLERIKWCNYISEINSELNDEPENIFKI